MTPGDYFAGSADAFVRTGRAARKTKEKMRCNLHESSRV